MFKGKQKRLDAKLLKAVSQNNISSVRELLESGADINTRSLYNDSILTLSIIEMHEDMALFLIKEGADLNIQNDGGRTALIAAANRGQKPIVKALIDAGADTNIVNSDYNTALDIAENDGLIDIVMLINPEYDSCSEEWKKISDFKIAHIFTEPKINQKITDVFNFESEERLTTVLDTKRNTQSSSLESFKKTTSKKTLEDAAQKLGFTLSNDNAKIKIKPRQPFTDKNS